MDNLKISLGFLISLAIVFYSFNFFEVETNEFGDIVATTRLCLSGDHNNNCIVEIGNTILTPNFRSSLIITITQDNDLDGIYNEDDNCKDGFQGWISNVSTDFDGDGCRDIDEDTDDEGDGILDYNDDCPIEWGNSTQDTLGCLDSDGDGFGMGAPLQECALRSDS